MGTALQVFYNLNVLCETVNSLLEDCRSRLVSSIDQTLDVSSLSSGVESTRKSDTYGTGEKCPSILSIKRSCQLQIKLMLLLPSAPHIAALFSDLVNKFTQVKLYSLISSDQYWVCC